MMASDKNKQTFVSKTKNVFIEESVNPDTTNCDIVAR